MLNKFPTFSSARHPKMTTISKNVIKLALLLSAVVLAINSCSFRKEISIIDRNKAPHQVKNRQLLKDMARFDQLYIPALRYTSLEKQREAELYMQLLTAYWRQFKVRYYDYDPQDPQWQAELDSIEALINGAKVIVDSGEKLIAAHQDYLEKIRIIFMDLRTRNGINDYFIDYLTRFHEPMETIVLAAKGKTPKTFTQQDMALISQTIPMALTSFKAIQEATIDMELFSFDEKQMAIVQKLIAQEGQALVKLQAALQKGNPQQIIAAAVNIKPNFAKLFMQFGDFHYQP